MAKTPRKRVKEVTQQTIDAARKPLTAEERVVYERVTREWQHEGDLGPEVILDSLCDKGWVDLTWKVTPGGGFWAYQRRHSLD